MVARAEVKYLKVSPRKMRLVLPLIKGMPAAKALYLLKAVNKKGAVYLHKALQSAVANAKQKGFAEDSLFVSKLFANEGPALKRYRSASFGRASVIRKRMTHIVVELDSSEKIMGDIKIR